jgi:predicted alpha/beta-hydrolase family hydrolase
MPSDAPSDERARHVLEVAIPMLFLQGTREARLTSREPWAMNSAIAFLGSGPNARVTGLCGA